MNEQKAALVRPRRLARPNRVMNRAPATVTNCDWMPTIPKGSSPLTLRWSGDGFELLPDTTADPISGGLGTERRCDWDETHKRRSRFAWTHRWRGQSRANPSLTSKFPASRENAGNFVDSGVNGASKAAKTAAKSVFYEPIPDAPEQGIFGARAGNLIGRSGNFSPRSGTPTKVT